MTTKRNLLGLALIIALSGHALIGCGDDSNDSPSGDEDGGTAGKGGTGGSGGRGGAGGKSGSGATAGKGGAGGAGGKGGAGGAAGSDDDAGVSCEGEKGCYSCEPKSYEQFLNSCTDAVCNAYDNSKLKKLGSDGALPPIP
jgi:hypothetical protein